MSNGTAEQHLRAALAWEQQGHLSHAEHEYRRVLALAPKHVSALNNLGILLAASGRLAEATDLFRRAVSADPRDAASWANLGAAQHGVGNVTHALEAFAQAVKLVPSFRNARFNLANLLRSLGRLEEARPHYRALLQRNPADGAARWNLAALEGLAGNLDTAFGLFATFHADEPVEPPPLLPRWAGEPLAGRRILLEANQGLGDTIMFARFAAAVRARGGSVTLRAQPELLTLLRTLDGPDEVVSREDPRPRADVWFPLVDLPAVLGPGSAAGPWPNAYLAPPPGARLHQDTVLRKDGRPCVGLVWAGNPTHPDDRNRSVPLRALEPIWHVDGVDFVSLQHGDARAQAAGIHALRKDVPIGDFAETAALLDSIDLLISIDTSALHLAGALGRPVWGLLAFAPDWRWGLVGRKSSWYPSLELFRQTRPGDWPSVAADVAQALRAHFAL